MYSFIRNIQDTVLSTNQENQELIKRMFFSARIFH
jgi:hypothetical protein